MTGKARKQQGMILPVVVTTLMVLGIFVFSYNYLSRRQYERLHYEETSEITSLLAVNGARFLAQTLQQLSSKGGANSSKSLLSAQIPELFAHAPYGKTFPEITGTPQPTGTFLDRTAFQFQNLLDSYQYQFYDKLGVLATSHGANPVCMDMKIQMKGVRSLVQFPSNLKHPQSVLHQLNNDLLTATDLNEMKMKGFGAGRDTAEKWGEVLISCTVYFRGLYRTAEIKRQFRVVSMIPGPYCRFTFFSPYSPAVEAFNMVGTTQDGHYDEYPVLSGGPPKRLVLINGTDTCDTAAPPPLPNNDAQSALANRGWVFLGPPGPNRVDPARNQSVVLRVPAGYFPNLAAPVSRNPFAGGYPQTIQSGVGGNIYLGYPNISSLKPVLLVPPREVKGTRYNLDATLGDRLWSNVIGFFTARDFPLVVGDRGAMDQKLWHKPDPDNPGMMLPITRSDCLSSWLMPYGSRQYISRTLMVGTVLADYLQYYQLWWDGRPAPAPAGNENYGILKRPNPKPSDIFQALDDPLTTANEALTKYFIWKGIFPPSRYADFLQDTPNGLDNLESVCPRKGNFPPQTFSGIPFNLLFDFMEFSPDAAKFPDVNNWKSFTGGLGTINDLRIVPGINGQMLNKGDPPGPVPNPNWRMVQPPVPFQLWNYKTPAGVSAGVLNNNTYYFGNLLDCHFQKTGTKFHDSVKWGLMLRATQIIDLGDPRVNPTKEMNYLIDSGVLENSTPAGEYVFRKPGIYFIKRPADRTGALTINKPIRLEGSGILVLDNGNLKITGVEPSSDFIDPDDGTSKLLFSLVALNGSIQVPAVHAAAGTTIKPIHAYLVALNPFVGDVTGNPASILNTSGGTNNPAHQLYVSGGIAAYVTGNPRKADPPQTYPTLYNNFFGGGIIRYNPRFNPCSAPDSERYQLVLDDVDVGITMKGK